MTLLNKVINIFKLLMFKLKYLYEMLVCVTNFSLYLCKAISIWKMFKPKFRASKVNFWFKRTFLLLCECVYFIAFFEQDYFHLETYLFSYYWARVYSFYFWNIMLMLIKIMFYVIIFVIFLDSWIAFDNTFNKVLFLMVVTFFH